MIDETVTLVEPEFIIFQVQRTFGYKLERERLTTDIRRRRLTFFASALHLNLEMIKPYRGTCLLKYKR